MNDEEKLYALNMTIKCCKNSAFYKSRLPSEPLKSLGELKKLPITTKEDLKIHSPFGFVCVPKKELYQYHETFGTTGMPASNWLTRDDMLDMADRVNKRGINFNDEDTVLIRFPYALSTISHFTHAAAQLKNACVIPASSRTSISPYTRIVNLLKKLEVTVLASLPLQAVLIAETAEMMGMKPGTDFPNLRAIYTAGEVMPPAKRKVIEDIWGVPVFDNYGMTEIGPAASSCEYGLCHPLGDSLLFEVLDEKLEKEVKPGETGYLVVTTLTRRGTPLIRYFTGDRVRMENSSCSCGETQIMQVRGRIQDIIQIGDKSFDLWDVWDMVSLLPCKRFWAVGPCDGKLVFILEEEKSGDCVEPQLIKALEEKSGVCVDVGIVPKGTLYDREELLSIGVVGKPKYVYTEDEMKAKAYLKSARN